MTAMLSCLSSNRNDPQFPTIFPSNTPIFIAEKRVYPKQFKFNPPSKLQIIKLGVAQ